MNAPLGVCSAVFDATANGADALVDIGITLEDEDTRFTSETTTYAVGVDQIPGAYYSNEVAGENPAQFVCSTFIDKAVLPNLNAGYESAATKDGYAYRPIGKQTLYGTLLIHPQAAGTSKAYDINGFKVSCTVNIDASYKAEDYVKADLIFNFSGMDDISDPLFGVVYTMGEFDVV